MKRLSCEGIHIGLNRSAENEMKSAGILLYRMGTGGLEVLLVHPGGPFWAKRDEGAWSIPKGEIDSGEDPLESAKREFQEETGSAPPPGAYLPLGASIQKSGKIVTVWATRGDLDPARIRSNRFALEWPPRSGLKREFPEIDRAEWFDLEEAGRRIHPGQRAFLVELARKIQNPKPTDS